MKVQVLLADYCYDDTEVVAVCKSTAGINKAMSKHLRAAWKDEQKELKASEAYPGDEKAADYFKFESGNAFRFEVKETNILD